jgi:hypothetical protein
MYSCCEQKKKIKIEKVKKTNKEWINIKDEVKINFPEFNSNQNSSIYRLLSVINTREQIDEVIKKIKEMNKLINYFVLTSKKEHLNSDHIITNIMDKISSYKQFKYEFNKLMEKDAKGLFCYIEKVSLDDLNDVYKKLTQEQFIELIMSKEAKELKKIGRKMFDENDKEIEIRIKIID